MKTVIEGSPSFSHLHIDLDPGEQVRVESGAMQSMSAELSMKAKTNGGFFSALLKRFFGGESFFVNDFLNEGSQAMRVTIGQTVPGEIKELKLNEGQEICLQKGSYIASSGHVQFKASWAGFLSAFAGEGLIRLKASGPGTLWFGGFGGIIEKNIDGDLKIDGGHLIAFDPDLKMKLGLAGSLISSFLGGEGFVTKVEGKGTVFIQSRSLQGLASWLNPKFRK